MSGDLAGITEPSTKAPFPIPHLQDFTANLHGTRVFSKLDLIRAYHQIPVHPEDVHKTAVTTPFGLFEFLRMPFGLRNAAQTFQRFMDEVLRGLTFAYAYIDDVLILQVRPQLNTGTISDRCFSTSKNIMSSSIQPNASLAYPHCISSDMWFPKMVSHHFQPKSK